MVSGGLTAPCATKGCKYKGKRCKYWCLCLWSEEGSSTEREAQATKSYEVCLSQLCSLIPRWRGTRYWREQIQAEIIAFSPTTQKNDRWNLSLKFILSWRVALNLSLESNLILTFSRNTKFVSHPSGYWSNWNDLTSSSQKPLTTSAKNKGNLNSPKNATKAVAVYAWADFA